MTGVQTCALPIYSIAIRHMTYLCMSWDHRALDGALAARFLKALADRLEAWPVS